MIEAALQSQWCDRLSHSHRSPTAVTHGPVLCAWRAEDFCTDSGRDGLCLARIAQQRVQAVSGVLDGIGVAGLDGRGQVFGRDEPREGVE